MGLLVRLWRTHPARADNPVSQRRLAAELNLSQTRLSRIESGAIPVRDLDALRWWARALNLPPELSWFGDHTRGDPDRRAAGEAVDAGPAPPGIDGDAPGAAHLFLADTDGLRWPEGMDLAQRLSSFTRHARSLDHRVGSRVIARWAHDMWTAARERLATGDHPSAERLRLRTALAEAAVNTGCLLLDAGSPRAAWRYMAIGERLSRDVGAIGVRVYALGEIAVYSGLLNRFPTGLAAARTGQELAVRLGSGRLLGTLTMAEAVHRAGLGERREALLAMDRGLRRCSRGPGDADPEWVGFFDPHSFASRVLYDLGEFDRARERFGMALAVRRGGGHRDRVALTMRAALNHLRTGEVEQASALTGSVLPALPGQVCSSWLTERVATTLRGALMPIDAQVVRETLAHWDEIWH
jgi:transcriptional regulator with XRE-family HTH domain